MTARNLTSLLSWHPPLINEAGAGRKPNSVPAEGGGGYLSYLLIAQGVDRPTRPMRRAVSFRANLVFLRMGFTKPLMSPSGRWALTSPFHPYLRRWV